MKATTFAAVMSLVAGACFPLQAEELYQHYQQRWAEAQYLQQGEARETALQALSTEVRQDVQQHPEDMALRTWAGIIVGSYAGAKGGLGALSLAEEAKADYEAVIAKDPSTLQGSALTSLGVLYYKVPGWPLGFGDGKQAEFMLKRGLNLNPDGIDSNFFYADYLAEKGDKEAARRYLQKALSAADRPGREVADRGRRDEIRALQKQLAE
ncbi:hypothetical protein ACFOSS_13155 [Pseudaeromonas sharmana]|uniref:Tetratricopeptide repeat protein n=1 Tax=Pseudaeromonas sharmana TaxID=328412 RepID=A0ABV8CQG5_9GAMM